MLFPQTWTELGPTNRPGVMKQLFLDDETKKLYASSPDGGLWVYDDFTNNTLAWHTLTGKLENLEIRAFAVASRNILYVATRTLKLYRSTNGGNSWQELEPDSSSGMVNVIAVPYDNPSMVFLGTVNGLFKSIDTGSTWYQVMIGNEVTDIKIDPSSDSILYAGVRNFGIKKSEDAGVSWSDFFPCHPRSGSIIRIALGYKNTNGTAQTAIDRSIAVKYGDSVWLKPAGSATFFNTGFTAKFGGGSVRTDTDRRGDWCNSINLNPFNPSEIWVGDADIHKGIVKDSDTVEWSLFTKRADKYHEDNHDFAFSKIVQDKLFKASDGVWKFMMALNLKAFAADLTRAR